ncbi:MAG: FtsX-like permease family protein, partial [Clostridia bacterium]|nr:FtsX-like permease family protein [Clostridia bacterium]
PVIFLLVSVLVIITTIDQLIFMERSKIGTLKSVGVNDKKILRHYSSYGAVLCGIGALLGLIIGPLIIPGIMFIKYDLVYSIPKEYVKLSYPWWLLAVFVFMVLVGYLVAFITSHKYLKRNLLNV